MSDPLYGKVSWRMSGMSGDVWDVWGMSGDNSGTTREKNRARLDQELDRTKNVRRM